MTKHFCDKCGIELSDVNQPHEGQITFTGLNAEISMQGVAGVGVIEIHQRADSSGEFCKGCVFDAIRRLDSRPRAVAETATGVREIDNA